MQRIHIFKPGKHTSAGGTTIEFSENVLRKAAESYDPEIHEAPIVVGHPKENGPAYGWVSGLDYSDGEGIYARPKQVEEQFSEMVQQGRFKKVSASFYGPEAPTNPVPGTYYLRHVGFLGATPPSIKGLQPVEFSETEEGVLEFNEFDIKTNVAIFKRLREWIIDKFSREEADSVVPDDLLDDLELAREIESDRQRREAEREQSPDPSFTENEDPDMKLQEQLDEARAEIDRLKAENQDFSERMDKLKEREAELEQAKIKQRVQALADAGKILPKEVDQVTQFAANLDNEQVHEFAEGEGGKATQREFYLAGLEKQPKRVDFGEHSAEANEPEEEDTPASTAQRITEYREAQAKKGHEVSFDQALRAVKAGKDKAE